MSVSQNRRMTTTKYDAAHYVVQLVRPTAYRPEGDTIYDYTLDPLPHFLQVLTISVCGMVLICSSVDIMYQLLALIGQLVFGQSLAVAAYRQSSLARGVSDRVLGEKMAPVLRHFFVV